MKRSPTALIRRLEKQLPSHGHLAKPIGNETLVVRLQAAAEEANSTGCGVSAVIHPDSTGTGLVIECCWAVNAAWPNKAEAVLKKCAETAFKLPLVQIQHDPRDGEVRLRVDCLGGSTSRRLAEQVAQSLKALNEFLTAIRSPSATPHQAPSAEGSAADTTARLEALARKPGGIHRLEKLLRLNQNRRPPAPPSSN